MIIKLSTGKEYYTNGNLISIKKRTNGSWFIGEGYDGGVSLLLFNDDGTTSPRFTKLELAEIIAGQLLIWNSFLYDVNENKVPTID